MAKTRTLRSVGKHLQEAVDYWNATYTVGTQVERFRLIEPRRDSAGITTTRSEAWLSSAGIPLVMVKGVSGGVPLSALIPVE